MKAPNVQHRQVRLPTLKTSFTGWKQLFAARSDRAPANSFILTCCVGFFLLATNIVAAGELKFASVFSDHMVLQRGMPVPVWGIANRGENVTVTFAGQSKSAKAGEDGRWFVKLDALSANSSPQSMTAKSDARSSAAQIIDVLVGEVWLASGQSNMEWSMAATPDSKADIPNTNHPEIRLLKIPRNTSLSPNSEALCAWQQCSPNSSADFSSVGYYFALKLHQELKIPIGIIQSAWGGTRIEPWTSLDGFEDVPELKGLATQVRMRIPGTEQYRAAHEKHITDVEQWIRKQRESLAQGQATSNMPTQPATLANNAASPTTLYNAMIHPLVPMAIRGTIWYQGESNHNEGMGYVSKTNALLASWRRAFGQPNLPFYFVQIAPYHYEKEDPEILPQFWVAQRECLKMPNTGMAVITDIGNIADIHPAQKKQVAHRIALWALANDYGRRNIDPSPPLYENYRMEGNSIRVKFSHATNGLKSRDGMPLNHFEISGADGLFHPADARIEGESVVINSVSIPNPRKVRFAWNKLAMPNLMNGAGIPACAFHTHWPKDPDLSQNFAHGCKWTTDDPNAWGWNTGLTDGSWNSNTPHCFATGIANKFPKNVTIDLGQIRKLNLVRFGVPEYGSTKTVAISLSEDGINFKQVGSKDFDQGKAQKAAVQFGNQNARFVRLVYLDNYAKQAGGFSELFGFTTELEAYYTK